MPSISREDIISALANVLERTQFDQLGALEQDRVHDNYTTQDGRCIKVVTDRVSAFDRVVGTLPLKGQLLTACTRFWFETTADVAPNYLLSVPDPNVMIVRECRALPVSFVVRAYLTGNSPTSIWVHYERGAREFCGHLLPSGMRKHAALPRPLLTPSTRPAHGEPEVSVSRAEVLRTTPIGADDFDAAAAMAMAVFLRGQKLCAERGLILVDTKYEFGKTPEGNLVLIDEMHTPDTSRFWFADTYQDRLSSGVDPESFDKEYIRRWLARSGFRGPGPIPHLPDEVRVEATHRYAEAIERIIGSPYRPYLSADIVGRIGRNLGLQ